MGRHAVTGAFGYSGREIATQLLAAGHEVVTLTNTAPQEDLFEGRVKAYPLRFDSMDALVASLQGVEVLFNTYWVRFNHKNFKHADAVRNTKTLFEAAARAGVWRVVHISITNPSEESPLEYFQGKAVMERYLRESGLTYAILRPTVIFGQRDILVNNIAWALRRLPVFGVFGTGSYRIQPIFVGDLASLALRQAEGDDNVVLDAIGPETFTYRELARKIGEIIGKRRPIVGVPPWLGYGVGWALGKFVGDVMITWPEVRGLMDDLLYVESPPTGWTRLTDWAQAHASTLGVRYASELARRKPHA